MHFAKKPEIAFALRESASDPYCGTPLGVEAAWCPSGIRVPPTETKLAIPGGRATLRETARAVTRKMVAEGLKHLQRRPIAGPLRMIQMESGRERDVLLRRQFRFTSLNGVAGRYGP
jgi:hypothetical protein